MNAVLADFPHDQLRVAPHSVEAEQAVLGGLMLAPEALAKLDWLKAEDFYRREHQAIFGGIAELAEKEQLPDVVTLGDWFVERGEAELVGDGAYLIELASTTPSAANIVAYAEIVKSHATRRRLIEVGTELVNNGFQPDGQDVSVIAGDAVMALAELNGVRRGSVKTAKQVGGLWFKELQARYERQGQMIGLPTPWTGFNRLTNGLQDKQLIIVAGRPSMGKSAWAVNVATSLALRGERALIFNLEMSDTSIYNRAVSSISDVPLAWLQQPDNEHEEYWARVTHATTDINASGLMIDDTAGLTMHQIKARCRRERMRAPVRLVVIDHLHLMPLPGKTKETSEIGHITAACKDLAKELCCPVVLLSQLNRSLESRQNKRPVMADLRESGAIEQDADVIVVLYRDDYYAVREGRPSSLAGFMEMIVLKNREGETGTAWGRNALAFGRIDDHDGDIPTIETTHTKAARRGYD